MGQVRLNVQLLRCTPSPEELVATAARICYSGATVEELTERVESRDQSKFILGLADSGHYSTFEHASFTFGVEGVSRALLAEITRHRIASFSVQSQRYVAKKTGEDGTGFAFVVPPRIEALGEAAVARFCEQMNTIQSWYDQWWEDLGGISEDARFVLPNATETRLIVTMNARELLHFFSLRCCARAQWEIHALAWEMLRIAKGVAPRLFASAGPGCVAGLCPEGKRSCGRMEEMRARAGMLATGEA